MLHSEATGTELHDPKGIYPTALVIPPDTSIAYYVIDEDDNPWLAFDTTLVNATNIYIGNANGSNDCPAVRIYIPDNRADAFWIRDGAGNKYLEIDAATGGAGTMLIGGTGGILTSSEVSMAAQSAPSSTSGRAKVYAKTSGGTTHLYGMDSAGTEYQLTSAGGGLPVDDTTALVRDPGDNTKLVRIDAGTVATATTRTITMPNADVDLGNLVSLNTAGLVRSLVTYWQGTTTTSNATATNIGSAISVPAGQAVAISMVCIGRLTTHDGSCVRYAYEFVAENVGGTVTVRASSNTATNFEASTPTSLTGCTAPNLAVSGATVQPQVNGIAATNMTWAAQATIITI